MSRTQACGQCHEHLPQQSQERIDDPHTSTIGISLSGPTPSENGTGDSGMDSGTPGVQRGWEGQGHSRRGHAVGSCQHPLWVHKDSPTQVGTSFLQ